MNNDSRSVVPSTNKGVASQALTRLLEILKILSGHPQGMRLTDISKQLAAPKSSLYNILQYLRQKDYLTINTDKRYQLGSQSFQLASAILSTREMSLLVPPFLTKLAEKSGETALFGHLANNASVIVYSDVVVSSNPVRYSVNVGDWRHLYCSSLGKLVLAYMPTTARENYFESRQLEPKTATTIVDLDDLKENISRIHKEGLSTSISEGVPGASAFAAPVFSADGGFIGGVVVAGPSERIAENTHFLISLVKQSAKKISSAMGHKKKEYQ